MFFRIAKMTKSSRAAQPATVTVLDRNAVWLFRLHKRRPRPALAQAFDQRIFFSWPDPEDSLKNRRKIVVLKLISLRVESIQQMLFKPRKEKPEI